jgi:DNA-directed RNA polymerase subunit L
MQLLLTRMTALPLHKQHHSYGASYDACLSKITYFRNYDHSLVIYLQDLVRKRRQDILTYTYSHHLSSAPHHTFSFNPKLLDKNHHPLKNNDRREIMNDMRYYII